MHLRSPANKINSPPVNNWLIDATVAVQARAKAEEVWDALSRVTVDHRTGDIVMNSQELQLACVWVLRGTVSSKDELELLEKCLTLKWADEALAVSCSTPKRIWSMRSLYQLQPT